MRRGIGGTSSSFGNFTNTLISGFSKSERLEQSQDDLATSHHKVDREKQASNLLKQMHKQSSKWRFHNEESQQRDGEVIGEDVFPGSLHAERDHPWMIIHPQSTGKIAWDIFISLLIFYSIVIIPFRIGFEVRSVGLAYAFDWLVDANFFLDIILSFFTAVWVNEELEVRLVHIAKHYLQTWFLIDLVSTLPLDQIVESVLPEGEEEAEGSSSLRSIKLIKFFRLVRLIKLARIFKLKKLGSSWEGALSINPALQRLLKLLLQIVFICHLLACFWFFMSTVNEESNWVLAHGLVNEQLATKYLASFYWTVASAMSVGYGDVHAVNTVEMGYSILVQVVGATCFGFIIANISAFLETFDPRASAYKSRMDRLKQYMRDRNLPISLQRRVRKYYDYVLAKESIFDDANILAQLPAHMTETVILHIHGHRARKIDFLQNEDSSFVAYIMARSKVLLALSGEVICEQGSVGTDVYMVMQGKVEAILLEEDKEWRGLKEKQEMEEEEALEQQGKERSMKRSLGGILRVPSGGIAGVLANKEPNPTVSFKKSFKTMGTDTKRFSFGMKAKYAVVAGLYNRGSNFGEVGIVKNKPHEITFRANRTTDLLSVSKGDLDYAIYLFPQSALQFRKRCDLHAGLLEESMASSTEYFPHSGRHVKAKVTVDGQTHQSAAVVEKRIGPLILSALIAYDRTGRFRSAAERKMEKEKQRSSTSTSTSFWKTGNVFSGSKVDEGQSLLLRTSVKVRRHCMNFDSRVSLMLNAPGILDERILSQGSKTKVVPVLSSLEDVKKDQPARLLPHLPSGDLKSSQQGHLDEFNRVGKKQKLFASFRLHPDLNAPPARKLNEIPVRSPTSLMVTRSHGLRLEDAEMELSDIVEKLMIVPPGHPVKIRWDVLMAFFIVYSVISVPFRIGFSQPAEGFWHAFDILVDLFFWLDMSLSFRTAFESPEDDVLVVVPKLIAIHYLRGWFVIDFLSTFPFDAVISLFLSDGGSNEALMSFRLIKVFRLVRLLKLMRILKLRKIIGEIESEIELSSGFLKLLTLFLQIFFVAHLFACFWLFSSSQSDGSDGFWYTTAGFSGNEDEDVGKKYLASLYWSFSTLTTVGFGDIAPTNDHERIYSIFIMILGATIFGYVIGSIASLISMLDIADALLKAKMTELDEYLSEQGIPKSLKKECKSCYAYSLSLKSVFDERDLLSRLSPSLRQEILITIHQQAVNEIPIFKNQTATFTADLLQVMQPQLALPNTFIMHKGDVGSNIYFIVQGEVLVYEDAWPQPDPDENMSFKSSKLLHQESGTFFGHEAVLSGKRSEITVKSLKVTQLYMLSKAAIGDLVDSVPPFALLLQSTLRNAIRRQDVAFGKTQNPSSPDRRSKLLWSLVQNHFQDILSMSPNRMRSLAGDEQCTTKLEALVKNIMK